MYNNIKIKFIKKRKIMDIKTFESLSCKEQIHLKGMAGAPNSSDSELAKSTSNDKSTNSDTSTHSDTSSYSDSSSYSDNSTHHD